MSYYPESRQHSNTHNLALGPQTTHPEQWAQPTAHVTALLTQGYMRKLCLSYQQTLQVEDYFSSFLYDYSQQGGRVKQKRVQSNFTTRNIEYGE